MPDPMPALEKMLYFGVVGGRALKALPNPIQSKAGFLTFFLLL